MQQALKVFFIILIAGLAHNQSSLYGCSWCQEWNIISPHQTFMLEEEIKGHEELTAKPEAEEVEEALATNEQEDNTALHEDQSKEHEDNQAPESAPHDIRTHEGGVDQRDKLASLLEALQNFDESEDSSTNLQKLFASLLENNQSLMTENNQEPIVTQSPEEIEKRFKEATRKVYKDYLGVFYPKVLVLTDYFYDRKKPMCAIAINAAIKEFIAMLSGKTWFVFKNRPEGFKYGEHWEIILEEFRKLDSALDRAYCDALTGQIIKSGIYDQPDHSAVSLTKYWVDRDLTTFYEFYGCYADYVVRMFNEGIHTQNVSQCSQYSIEFKKIIKRIPETMFDGKYHEHERINKELLAELKKKLGIEEESSLFDDFLHPTDG